MLKGDTVNTDMYHTSTRVNFSQESPRYEHLEFIFQEYGTKIP